MKIALYNQMFGLNGKSIWATLTGHWAIHYQANPQQIWRRTNFSNTIDTVLKSKADIIGLVEVLEGQENIMQEKLKNIGYNFYYLGQGHKTKYGHLFVQVMLASKIPGKQQTTSWPVENTLGGGGGFVHVSYPSYHVLLAHFGLPSKDCYSKQMSFLEQYVKKLEGKVLLLGDFNKTYSDIHYHFPQFDLATKEIPSCSTTPILKWFYNKDVDHILLRGLTPLACGAIEGNSDHRLIYAQL